MKQKRQQTTLAQRKSRSFGWSLTVRVKPAQPLKSVVLGCDGNAGCGGDGCGCGKGKPIVPRVPK